MGKHDLKSEIWEIQVILYWILDLLIFRFTDLKWLGYIVLVWSIISLIGVFWQKNLAGKKGELDG